MPYIWIITFFLSRIIYMCFLDPYHYSVLPPEERYIGFMAKEFLEGMHFSFLDYQANTYLGGSFIAAGFGALSFLVLGDSLFALKIPSLLLACSALVVWYKLLGKYYSNNVANAFALLFTFSPLAFTHYNVTALGTHSDTLLLSALSVTLFFKIIYEGKSDKIPVLLLGLITGFSIWFSYLTAIVFFTILIYWIIKDTQLFFKKLPFLIAGTALGFSPWIFTSFFREMQGLTILGKQAWEYFNLQNFLAVFEHYRNFVGYHLFLSLGSPIWGTSKNIHILSASLFSGLFSLLLLGYFLSLKKKLKFTVLGAVSKPTKFFILHIIIFLILVEWSSFHSIRYFIPLFPFLFVLLAIGFSFYKEHVKFLAKIFCFSLIGITFFTNQFTLSMERPLGLLKTPGYKYQFLENSVCKEWNACIKNYKSFELDLSDEDLYDFSFDLAIHMTENLELSKLEETVQSIEKAASKNFLSFFYYFLGRKIQSELKVIARSFKTIEFLKNNLSAYKMVRIGILDELGNTTSSNGVPLMEPPQGMSFDLMLFYWRSIGKQSAFLLSENNIPVKDFENQIKLLLSRVDGPSRSLFLQGVGKFFYDWWSTKPLDPPFNPEILENFSEGMQKNIMYGVGLGWAERDFNWRIADQEWYWDHFAKKLSPFNQQIIEAAKKDLLSLFQA